MLALKNRLSEAIKRALCFDIGIDLGTANTVVFVRGIGIVLNEPSVVALDRRSNNMLAIGKEARDMVGRTPGNIISVRPLRDGVIADYHTTEAMIRHFIEKAKGSRRFCRPRVLIGIPYGVTNVERRAVLDAAKSAGARWAYVIEEPMAAAIGAGLNIEESEGKLIVDIGGGTTEVAALSLGGIVVSESIRVAGDECDQAIIQHCRKTYNVLIGERMAEDIKIQIGSISPFDEEKKMSVTGRDLVTGLPKTFSLSDYEIRQCIYEPMSTVLTALRRTLERTPPEIAADIVDNGVTLTGGGALLHGLDEYLESETGIQVNIAKDPLACVALGAGTVLDELDSWTDKLA